MNMRYQNWRKSSYSAAGENCVEVGSSAHVIGVRDTKQNGAGPVLEFTRDEWRTFLHSVRTGEQGA